MSPPHPTRVVPSVVSAGDPTNPPPPHGLFTTDGRVPGGADAGSLGVVDLRVAKLP
jgi:hypothetical protein